jgi:hypothetical protein
MQPQRDSAECQERQQLLHRLRSALDDLSVATRESRSDHDANGEHKRSIAARTKCEESWTALQRHQAEHRCWPGYLPENASGKMRQAQ